jgi:DNA-binding transcriptional LysR family regulator
MFGIAMSNLRRLNLNHLLTLDALLSERNVTRAAQRLHLSQPSVSVRLAKLRSAFKDPLLIPGAGGMILTARAEELREPLRGALEKLEQAVQGSAHFDPRKASNTWRMAAADYGESTVLLPVLAHIRKEAPGTRLAVAQVVPMQIARQLESADVDLALQVTDQIPPGLHHQTLFEEQYVLVGRRGHPRLKRKLSIERFCALDHVIVSPDGGGFRGITDTILMQRGLERRVVLSVPHFFVAISAIKNSDIVGLLPSRLVNPAELSVVGAPVNVPGYRMGMVWHERSHRDPAHKWLRSVIAKSF